MKILRVISSVNPENGGPINGLVNSSKVLSEKGHEITVLSLDDPTSQYVSEFQYPLVCFKGFSPLQFNQSFKVWLLDNVANYDVVIIHGLWQYHGYATFLACVKHQVPYVVFSHGMLDPWFNEISKLKTLKKNIYWKLFESKVIENASRVLFTSEEEKTLARTSFQPYRAKEHVVAYGSPLPNVNLEQCKHIFLEKHPQLNNKKFGLFLSRIHPKKGIDLLIKAFANVDNLPEDFNLVIAGPDKDKMEEKLMKFCPDKLINRIHWVGMLSGEVKWGAYQASEYFVLPSHQENFGIVVAEALSTATPVLISNKVNIWREIKSANAGFVESDSLEGSQNLLEQWFTLSNKKIKKMQDDALTCYKNNFSIEAAADELEAVLLNVIEKNHVKS